MNPRMFCREYRYPKVLALTYSFDPLFFERIILRDLGYGGSTDITIVGDKNELQGAVARYAGQINYLGKTYLVSPAETFGAFHPKLLLRVSNKGARLLLGSGNLTFGGWGGNRELVCQLNLDANQPGAAAVVNSLLDHTAPYLSSEVGKNALARLRDYPWLAVGDETKSNILMTTPEEPLANQLQRRWAGRRFSRMVAFTGSTDERGAFITWCHEQFGVEECVVVASPENASFVKEDIDRCPAKVTLAPFGASQMLHAKFFWFDGPDGPAAVVGSANCSSAAWLRSPLQGGNVELVQIYDTADGNDFTSILSVVPTERFAVERSRPTEVPTEEKSVSAYYVKGMHLYRGQGFVDVTLNQSLPEKASACLICQTGEPLPLTMSDNGVLVGQVPETTIWPETTCLAKVQISVDDTVIDTPMHWLDDIDAITRASQIKPPAEPFKNLPRSSTSSEHDKVVSDLAMISASIFSDNAAYKDPPKKNIQHQSGQDGGAAEPVKPEDLVKSLNDLKIGSGHLAKGHSAGVYLSMTGVMRALFEEVEALPKIEDEAATVNPDDPAVVAPAPPNSDPKPPAKKKRELPADKHKQRLKDELIKFFDKFTSEEFVAECTASKLVQAAAYPLAVALLGERGSWLGAEESRAIVTQVVDILLNRNRVGRSERGLLEEVRNRYQAKGQEDIFLQVAGDGTLWVVLLAVMAKISWDKDFEKFERAINLHRIYGCEAMRSDTSVGKLTALVTRLDVERARDLIAEEAPRVATAVDAIEKLLRERREALLGEQALQNHRVGDLIWHPNTGWGVVKEIDGSATTMEAYLHLRGEKKPVAKKGFFVNLRMAAEKMPELKQLVSELGIGL